MKKHNFVRKPICVLLAFAMIACATLFYGCNGGGNVVPPDTREEVVIGSDEYRPFFYTDGDGLFSGIDVELATEAFSRMGYKATFKQIEWNRKDILLESGEVDCLWGSFSMTGREKSYSWAGPYMNSDQVVLVKNDSDINAITDLNGKSVAVQATSKPDEIFSEKVASGELTLKNLFCFTSIDNVFASLRKGYADAIAGHRTAIQERVKNYSDNRYRYLDEPLVRVNLGVAFKKGTHKQMTAALSATLAEMAKDGTTEKILKGYGVDVKSALDGMDGYDKSEFKERYGSLVLLSVLVLVGCVLMSVFYSVFTAQDQNKTYAEMERIIEYVKNQCVRYDDVSSESQTKSLISIVDKARNIRREYIKTVEEQRSVDVLKEFVEDQRITGVLIKSDLNSDNCEYFSTDDNDASFWNETIKKFASVALVEEKSYSQRITVGEYYYDYAIISDGNGGIILCYFVQLISSADGTLLNVSTLLDGFDISDMTIVVTNGVSVVASNDSSYENRPISDFEEIADFNGFGETNKLEKVTLADSSVYYGDKGAVKSFFVYTFLDREQVYKDGSVKMAYFLVVYIGLSVCIMVTYNMIDKAKKKQKLKGEEEYRKNLDRLAAEAIRANEAKNDFLRRMSHDIRTPINGIQGIVRIGDYYADDPEKQKECRQKVLKASGYLLELVNDVLDMSKLDQNQVTWTEENFDILEVVDDIANMFLTQVSEHAVTLEYKKSVTHSQLYGGAVPLKRICANIIGNAIKYNKPNGKIDFSLTETACDDEKISFSIVCADTGIGMSEEFQKIMYEPFAQENPNENSRGGTGLGLAIVKKTIDLLGGTISVDSKAGKGTTFTVNLSFAHGKEAESSEKIPGSNQIQRLFGMTALLVEDNALNAEIAQFILETNGAKVVNAANGKEAVDKFAASKEGEISVILMDVMMPVMDGISATRAIRSLDRLDADEVPIIAMTANTYQDDIERALAAGMTAFVAKPVDSAKLIETIAKCERKG